MAVSTVGARVVTPPTPPEREGAAEPMSEREVEEALRHAERIDRGVELVTYPEQLKVARALLALHARLRESERALREIVDFPIDDNASGAWHFAEVRWIARNYFAPEAES